MQRYDPFRAAFEIREQLASEKRRLAFFLGAGSSMAVGMPGIAKLTDQVAELLKDPLKSTFKALLKQLPEGSNVEHALDRIRTCRELLGTSETKTVEGITGASAARTLDLHVCQAIGECVRGDSIKDPKPHFVFSQWLRALHGSRDFPVEIFTTNYDLLLEHALERCFVPYFDGFCGSVAPFFVPECVEADQSRIDESIYPPRMWTRLWKLHGSINWHLKDPDVSGSGRITRYSGPFNDPGQELVIFPSRDKYVQSRKLPFLSFQDRLRKVLSRGESLLIILGYSFSDEHLNEIIFQGLRSNPRATAIAFIYGDKSDKKESALRISERVLSYGKEYRNLALYGPDKICVGGITSSWDDQPSKRTESTTSSFWDQTNKRFILGDFNAFGMFLEEFIGFQPPSKGQPGYVARSEHPQSDGASE